MEGIADRVDLVKRACDASTEITRQLGAELALAQSTLRRNREHLDEVAAEVRRLAVALQAEADARSQEHQKRLAAEQTVATYAEAIAKVRKVFGPGFGPRETAAVERLTPPQRRALDRLLALPAPAAEVPAPEHVGSSSLLPEMSATPQGPS